MSRRRLCAAAMAERRRLTPVEEQGRGASLLAIAQILASTVAIIVVATR